MGKTAHMSVLPLRVRRTLIAIAALAGLLLTTGQACATPPNGGTGTSHAANTKARQATATKNKNNSKYDQYGYDQAGYDRNGYDKNGYDKNGYDRKGYDRSGFDRNGYDRYGYDQNGYDESGCNRAGYDRDGDKCGSGRDSHSHKDHHDDDDN
jgi:hypothetical protein